MPTRRACTNAEATSPSSRGTARTGRENENRQMTWQAAREDRWLSRLTVTGGPGQPAGDSMRGTYRQKRAATWQGENRSLGLDFGELIEGTEKQLFSRISHQSIPDTLSANIHGVSSMLWISASATSGEWPRMVDHWSLGISLVLWATGRTSRDAALRPAGRSMRQGKSGRAVAFACERGARQPGARNACGTSRRLCKV